MNNILYKEIEPKDDIFHKEIIDTFFGKSEKPTHAKKIPPLKKDLKPAIITALILSAGLVFLISLIIVKFLPARETAPYDNRFYSKIVYNGIFDRNLVETFAFEGDAKANSMILRNSIKLVNTEKLGWARATFDLNASYDLSNSNMLIMGRTKAGRKSVILIMSDTKNRICEFPNIIFSPGWEWKNIESREADDFDFKNVKSIAIEYGKEIAGNDNGAIIYIKEIGVRRGGV